MSAGCNDFIFQQFNRNVKAKLCTAYFLIPFFKKSKSAKHALSGSTEVNQALSSRVNKNRIAFHPGER